VFPRQLKIKPTSELSLGQNKAAGPDKLKLILLQNLPQQVVTRIRAIYIVCQNIRYKPIYWTASRTIFISESGKSYSQNARASIFLSSLVFKSLQKQML
jgi:hypothetical protein